MQQIANWLGQLGLGQYAERFTENEIDVSVLRLLTDQDLKDIGVPLGHRRKILAAIAELGTPPLWRRRSQRRPYRRSWRRKLQREQRRILPRSRPKRPASGAISL